MSSRNFMLKIGGAVDPSLSKSFQTSSKEMKKLSDEMLKLKSTNRHISKLKASEEKLEKQFASGREEYKRQQRELFGTSKKVNDLRRAIEKTKKPSKSMINEFKKAQKAENHLKETTENQKKALTDMMRQMKAAKNETKRYSQSQEELAKSMKKVEERHKKLKEYENLKKSVSNNAGGTFARSAGQAVGLGVAVKFAIDDEEAFADVRKTTGLAGEEAKKFQRELKKATKDIPKFNSEIYEIAAAAGQAGINLQEIPQFTSDTAKVSVAFDMEAGKAGETLATWREAFKMSQSEVIKLADQMNLLGDSIKVAPTQVAEIATQVGGLGRMANFTEAQTSALGGTLIALGVKDAGTASTAIRKLYTTMASGDSASSTMSTAFQKIGIDPGQLAEDLQKDSQGALMKVFQGLNDLNDSEKLSVTKQLFGEEAMSSMGMLINNTKFLKENLKLVGDATKYAGSVNNEYNNKLNTTASDIKLALKATTDMAASTTRFFLPPIRGATKGMVNFSEGITKFTEDYPKLAKAMAFGAAGFVGLKLGTSGAVLGIKMLANTKKDLVFLKETALLIKGWKQWGPVLSGVKTGVTALGAAGKAMLFNPWVLGIGAVVAGGYLIYKNWDLIKEGFKNSYEYISGKLSKLWELWKKFTVPGKMFSWVQKKYKGYKEKGIPAYAKGGVVGRPHLALIGDGRTPESIIPHDGTQQSKDLWFNAGEKLGMFAGEGVPKLFSKVKERAERMDIRNKIEVNIDFNPVIRGESYKGIVERLREEMPALAELIEGAVEKAIIKNQKKERRVSFG